MNRYLSKEMINCELSSGHHRSSWFLPVLEVEVWHDVAGGRHTSRFVTFFVLTKLLHTETGSPTPISDSKMAVWIPFLLRFNVKILHQSKCEDFKKGSPHKKCKRLVAGW
jgi:hypothetical protein